MHNFSLKSEQILTKCIPHVYEGLGLVVIWTVCVYNFFHALWGVGHYFQASKNIISAPKYEKEVLHGGPRQMFKT